MPHYISSGWRYQPIYPYDDTLRPELKIDLTVRTPVLPAQDIQLDYLIERFTPRQATSHPTMPCVSVAETLTEKVLSFLRRYAQRKANAAPQAWDDALVRHIYDVHCIVSTQAQCEPTSLGSHRYHYRNASVR